MRLQLDPQSPVPLYHQLAETLRYRIATGALRPGQPLPPLRAAARRWGVNLHTVRHAYAALASQGLVRTDPPHGTTVLGGSARSAASRKLTSRGPENTADRFLARMVQEAADRYGLTPDDIRRRLPRVTPPAAAAAEPVHVVECSETQAADLALQLGARWNVAARGWSLERPGEPPAGPIVATYFHYNDLRTRWPERMATIRFVAIHPDPSLAVALAPFRRRGRRTLALVCEREASMAANIAADLRAVLDTGKFELSPRVKGSAAAFLANAPARTPLLFSPRLWGSLSPAQRADPRAIEIRYRIDPTDLEALGNELEWTPSSARAFSPAITATS